MANNRLDRAGFLDASDGESQRSMRDAWDAEAENWVRWARAPGHDSYWQFHRDAFRRLLSPPAGRALDVGCGEGRLPRDLKSWGYQVVGVDGSETMIRYAREADPEGEYLVADAAALPFHDSSFELVTAFMSLQDVDDPGAAIRECARVLVRGGHLCVAVVHPMSSAGRFISRDDDAPFVIAGSYLEPRSYEDYVERDGLSMTFASQHRPIQTYVDLTQCGGRGEEAAEALLEQNLKPGWKARGRL